MGHGCALGRCPGLIRARATVYRRFPDKTSLLIATIEAAYGDHPPHPEILDIEHLVTGWAQVLADPRQRRRLRRLYGAIDDDPELARAYRDRFGAGRDQVRRDVLERARELGQLPPDTEPDVLLDTLTGAVWQHFATRSDIGTAEAAGDYLRAVLRQSGYHPEATHRITEQS